MVQLKIIHRLVKEDDPKLGKILDEIDGPMFAISWILTWFAHTFTDLAKIQRVFDFLLCSEPQTIAYLSAAFILSTKDKLQESLDECEEGTQIGVVFQFYQNAHINEINIDFSKWFNKCEQLEKHYKFDQIRKEYSLPRDSNLYQHEFNKLLEYRKEMKALRITKILRGFKQFFSFKNATFVVISAALMYYTFKHLNIKLFGKAIHQQ